MLTTSWISEIFSGSLILATPPCALMSAGTLSSAITATAPASSATLACSALTTSMMTPPLSIWAIPLFTLKVPVEYPFSAIRFSRLLECVRDILLPAPPRAKQRVRWLWHLSLFAFAKNSLSGRWLLSWAAVADVLALRECLERLFHGHQHRRPYRA